MKQRWRRRKLARKIYLKKYCAYLQSNSSPPFSWAWINKKRRRWAWVFFLGWRLSFSGRWRPCSTLCWAPCAWATFSSYSYSYSYSYFSYSYSYFSFSHSQVDDVPVQLFAEHPVHEQPPPHTQQHGRVPWGASTAGAYHHSNCGKV